MSAEYLVEGDLEENNGLLYDPLHDAECTFGGHPARFGKPTFTDTITGFACYRRQWVNAAPRYQLGIDLQFNRSFTSWGVGRNCTLSLVGTPHCHRPNDLRLVIPILEKSRWLAT